jgi:protein transport protein HofQ
MAWKTNLKHRFIIGLVLGLLAAAGITAQTPDTGKPIENLQFQSADIRSVLTFLADYGGVNVVIAPGVEGTVTIKLRDVQWRQAMDIIGRTYNLAVVDEDGGYIRILDTKAHREELNLQLSFR